MNDEKEKFTLKELLILKNALKYFKSAYSDNLWILEAEAVETIKKAIDNLIVHKYYKEKF